ncbi:MAG: sugar phosphate isomerase/epimerase [Pirellulaceae bacterium]|nr:sugar phosphate isomerase/epimerase [Pirellulaceae bacterium]
MPLQLVYSTDNWRPEWWSAEQCFARTRELGGKYVELTTATGYNLLEGLGFSPYVSIDHDPYIIRDLLAKYDLELVSIDADWPIWSHNCIDVLNKTIVWADMLGCRTIITTDSDQYPEGRTDEEWCDIIKYHFSCVLPVAERHNVSIALEPHGRLTTQPEVMLRLVTQNNTPLIGVNFDTGNSYIAGQAPVAFLELVKDHVVHMHLKDVSEALAAAMRGEETGIASSEVAVGEGVNAENISKCLDIMIATGREIPVSPEAGGDILTVRSVEWLKQTLRDKGQPV